MNKTILLVDDMPENLDVLKEILRDRYMIRATTSGRSALKIVEKSLPDLILLDVMMPEMNGFETCRLLKSNAATAHIPVIFVTAKTEAVDEAEGFDAGAVDYITKPVSAPIVLRRVQTHLSLTRVEELNNLARDAIQMLGEAGHYNDTDTGAHIWRMASYSKALALKAGWSDEKATILELAAPMHDTGKIGIPDAVLKAPRKLTAEEWVVMKEHARIGAEILRHSDNPVFRMASDIARFHHEKWDGSGYPAGLAGKDIPQASRIVSIADVFDALTMKRPYKKAWTVADAMAEIKRSAGSHFDPDLVGMFLEIEAEIVTIRDKWDEKDG